MAQETAAPATETVAAPRRRRAADRCRRRDCRGRCGCRRSRRRCRSRAAEAAPAPTISKADTVWVLVSAALVIFMTLPGLALFYGGLVRSKNVLSILMQNLVVFSLVAVLWALYGYSLAFTEGNAVHRRLATACSPRA